MLLFDYQYIKILTCLKKKLYTLYKTHNVYTINSVKNGVERKIYIFITMDRTLWLSYVGTVLILVISPGPSVLLATANSMKHGYKKTVGTILGDLSANLLQIILASAGLASVILSSGHFFYFIKWLGVLYLVFMGIRKVIENPNLEIDMTTSTKKSFWNLYSEGFLMSAANPKAIVFFAALFPLFINKNLALLPQIIGLTLTFLCMDGLSLILYTRFAARLKSYLEDKEKIHLQNKIIGSLLLLSAMLLSMVKRTVSN